MIRMALALTQGEVADTPYYHRIAAVLRSGGQLYVDTAGRFPYPPVWNHVEVASLALSERTGVPFVIWVKLPSILADAAIALLLAALAPVGRAALFASAYALNPVPILISGAHGQFDSLPILCCLAAVYFVEKMRSAPLAALALTLGIALKSFPVLLLPVFLMQIGSWPRKLRFAAIALVPAGLILLPHLAIAPRAVASELFGYSGVGDHGWMAIARIVQAIRTRILTRDADLGFLLSGTKLLFLLGCAAALVSWARMKEDRRPALPLRIAFVFMLFYTIYGGISSQSLLWALPFLMLANVRDALIYSAVAFCSLASFYAAFYPGLLFRDPPTGLESLLTSLYVWLAGTAVWWLFSLSWTARTALRWRHFPIASTSVAGSGAS